MSTEAELDEEFMQEMLGEFLSESEEILSSLNENLLELDEWAHAAGPETSARCDSKLINEMFRGAHSLKGLSGMLGLDAINELTHRTESLLDAIRNEKLALDRALADLIFRAIDKLKDLINQLTDQDAEPVDCSSVVQEITQILDGESPTASDSSSEKPSESDSLMNPSDSPTPTDTKLEDETKTVAAQPAEIDPFADVADETDVSDKYLSIFIDESEISLDTILEILLEEQIVENKNDALMIQCHRVKGSAASIGLNKAAHLAHVMEDLLQELLKLRQDLTPQMTEAMVSCADALRNYVDTLKEGEPRTEGFRDAYFRLHVARLAAAGESSDDEGIADANAVTVPEDRNQLQTTTITDSLIAEIRAAQPDNEPAWVAIYQFEPALPLVGLKARLLVDRVTRQGAIFYSNPPEDTLEDVPDLDGMVLGITGLSDTELFCAEMQVVGLESVKLMSVSDMKTSDTEPAAGIGDIVADEDPVSDVAPSPPTTPVNVDRPAQPSTEPLATPASKPAPANEPTSPTLPSAGIDNKPPEARKKPAETLRVDIERLDQLMNLAGELVISKARFAQIEDGLKGTTVSRLCANSLSDVFSTLDRITRDIEDYEGNRERPFDVDSLRNHMRRLRVDLSHVDAGMDGFRRAGTLVNDLADSVHQLERVADGIQKTVMDTRMVPVGPLFRRFKRVIRDISNITGKDIGLEINGESTELDKRMIDELGDPLIHMVRNSADHGIEPPDERESLGKPRRGTVTLDAYHRGNSILVEITDDGKGLSAEKIKAKALERGIISEQEAEKMSEHQIFQLIWEPGLSTAEKITEVSGRGMGMDIVRAKIEDLNGTVELSSVVGKGTKITVKLPLTLAILPSLLVRIADDVIAMPVESVSEIVPLKVDALSSVHGKRTADVRGRVVSVVRLSDLFCWNEVSEEEADDLSDEKSLVIITTDGRELGLVVDQLLGEQDIVIKSLAENYRNVDGIAGASILGDGSVSLILDVVALLELSARPQRATNLLQKANL